MTTHYLNSNLSSFDQCLKIIKWMQKESWQKAESESKSEWEGEAGEEGEVEGEEEAAVAK